MHRSMMLLMFFSAIGCQRGAPPTAPVQSATPDTGEHVARDLAVAFVDGVGNNLYADSILEFPADEKLSAAERVAAFRKLESYIMSDSWTVVLTAITVVDGKDDSAEVYFKGPKIGWLLLMCEYHYDTGDWKLGAYEIPDRSFARPDNMTFGEYIEKSLTEARSAAKRYTAGAKADGIYFLE